MTTRSRGCWGCKATFEKPGTCGAGLIMPDSIKHGADIAEQYPQNGHTYICLKKGMRQGVEAELVRRKLRKENQRRGGK